ncbi:MAG: hypothetical protein A2287_09375 [Candidatus Melainabacteria bacterium RIFOXYA12_FULL_32_12]|nr:MAG: hypothetical protein A2255_07525 [Candidatus Melainabacteria bacterium RIFOXYA2_FULL_32_9]OGI31211.1 MAG: hypothetical protein A2287_09375 [Candidatus Melainabacteria bacterium RIFOXYA12_FULL_32_12]
MIFNDDVLRFGRIINKAQSKRQNGMPKLTQLSQDTVCLNQDKVNFKGFFGDLFGDSKEMKELLKSGADKQFLKEVENSLWGDTNALYAHIKWENIKGTPENIKAILMATQVTPKKSLIPYYGEILKELWNVPKEAVVKTLEELKINQEILDPLGYKD